MDKLTPREINTLNFLTQLCERTKGEWTELSINKLKKKCGVSSIITTLTISNNIVLLYRRGNVYKYKWNSIKPNIKMARRLLELARERENQYRRDQKERERTKKTPKTKNMKTQKVKENNEAPALLSVDTTPYRAFEHLAISQKDAKKLINEHGKEMVDSILDKIENYPNLKKYKSLYLTAKEWIKNELRWQKEQKEEQRRKEEQQKKQAEQNRKRLENMNVAKNVKETKKVSILWGLYSYEKTV